MNAALPACTHQVNSVACIDLRFTTRLKKIEETVKASEAAEAAEAKQA